jgi:hypothetical protein
MLPDERLFLRSAAYQPLPTSATHIRFCRMSRVEGRRAARVLNRDELYVNLGCLRKCAQVGGV